MRKVAVQWVLLALVLAAVIAAAVMAFDMPNKETGIQENMPAPSYAVQQASDVTVTTYPVNYGTESLTVDICVPVVSGFTDKAFEKALNAQMYRHIKTDATKARQQAQIFYDEMLATGYEPWMFIFVAGYDVKNNGGILSVKVRTLLDNGGTGLPHTVYYNADIKQNKRLVIRDLFDGAEYAQVIDGIIRSEMNKDEARFFKQDSFAGISDKTQFFISEGTLHIAFAKYQLASGMTGEPEFNIPTDAIRRFLKAEYAPLFK